MTEVVFFFNSDTMYLIKILESFKTSQKFTVISFIVNSEDITQLKSHKTSCKERTTEEKRRLIIILSSSDVKNNSRSFSTSTKSIKSQKSEDAAEIENLNIFHLNKNSPLTKARMCMIQVMSMLTSKAKTELTAAILTLDKARNTEDLKSLKDSTDKLSATIFKAEEVSIHAQLSEYKRETDQKMNKLFLYQLLH